MSDKLLPGTDIACANAHDVLRIYAQDEDGDIFESCYDGFWKKGANIARTTPGRGFAVAFDPNLNGILLYYVDPMSVLREMNFERSRGTWVSGKLDQKNFKVSGLSRVAARMDGRNVRVFAQLDDATIQEYLFDNSQNAWRRTVALGIGRKGTSIATIPHGLPRVYYQLPNLNVAEKAFGSGKWSDGVFSFPTSSPKAALAAVSVVNYGLRVYTSDGTQVFEHSYEEGSWAYKSHKFNCIEGSHLGVLCFGRDNIRLYLQDHPAGTSISEFSYRDGWSEQKYLIRP